MHPAEDNLAVFWLRLLCSPVRCRDSGAAAVFFLQVRGSKQTQPTAESHAPAVTEEAARDGVGGADFSVAGDGESVADGLAKTMNSPWRTPPAMVVDMEPLRDVRQLMIQARVSKARLAAFGGANSRLELGQPS